MSSDESMFEDAIETLAFSRQATLGEAGNIPDDRWDFRPHPDAKSVSEIVRHILETTAMLAGEAADPEGDFQRRSPKEHVRAHLGELPDEMTPAELREALASAHEETEAKIRDAGESDMSGDIRRFDGGTWRRLTYVFYAASHESYHCGQLATYARALGLVPALTQRIRARGSE